MSATVPEPRRLSYSALCRIRASHRAMMRRRGLALWIGSNPESEAAWTKLIDLNAQCAAALGSPLRPTP